MEEELNDLREKVVNFDMEATKKDSDIKEAEHRLRDLEDQLSFYQQQHDERLEAKEKEDEEDDRVPIDPALEESADPDWILPKFEAPVGVGDVDAERSQVYLMRPGVFLKPLEKIVGYPIKLGSTDNPYERIVKQHGKDFGMNTEILDSIVTKNPVQVERKLKRYLKMKNRFVAAKTPKKKSTETEVIVVQNQEDYRQIYAKAKEFAGQVESEMRAESDIRDTFAELREEIASLRRREREHFC